MSTSPHSDRYDCCRVSDVNKHLKKDLAKYAEEARHMNGENSKKAKELAELHCQLATNMGHQNQKQKIRYMVIKHYITIYLSICSDQNQARVAGNKRATLRQEL